MTPVHTFAKMRSAELNGHNKGEMDHYHKDCSGPIEQILRFPWNQFYGLQRDFTHFDQVQSVRVASYCTTGFF